MVPQFARGLHMTNVLFSNHAFTKGAFMKDCAWSFPWQRIKNNALIRCMPTYVWMILVHVPNAQTTPDRPKFIHPKHPQTRAIEHFSGESALMRLRYVRTLRDRRLFCTLRPNFDLARTLYLHLCAERLQLMPFWDGEWDICFGVMFK